jgi:hypothetical protein
MLAGALVAHALYKQLCPRLGPRHCSIEWLSTQLELSPEQKLQFTKLHKQHWEHITQVMEQRALCGENCKDDCCKAHDPKACSKLTGEFIQQVCALLNQEQRQKFERLVSPCSKEPKTWP